MKQIGLLEELPYPVQETQPDVRTEPSTDRDVPRPADICTRIRTSICTALGGITEKYGFSRRVASPVQETQPDPRTIVPAERAVHTFQDLQQVLDAMLGGLSYPIQETTSIMIHPGQQ